MAPSTVPVVSPATALGAATVGTSVFGAVLRWQRTLDVSGRCNEKTRRSYRRTLMSFLADVLADPDWDGPRDPFALTEDDLVAYLGKVNAVGGKRNMYVRALRSFYGWVAEREDENGQPLMARNPMRHITPAREKYGPAPSLSPEQLDAVLTAAEAVDPRARWAIQLQYATACRAGSLVAVTKADLRDGPAGPSIVFREAKNDDPYEVPLGPKAAQAAAKLVELEGFVPKRGRRRETLVGVGYTQYENWVKEAERRSGVKVWSHLLRHTAITRMAEAGVDVRTVMEMANWHDPMLLRRYAAASDPNLRAASSVL